MSKENKVKLVIEIDEEIYKRITNRIKTMREEMRKSGYVNEDFLPFDWVAIADGKVITIPDNPTNGDMIKALFPNIDFKRGDFYIIPLYHDDRGRLVDAMGCCRGFEIDWWDAPYGREENKK